MNYKIIEPTTNEQWEQYYAIRYEVLRKPWNQPLSTTKDDTEQLSQHFLVVDENGNFVHWLEADEQDAESMLRLLGY